jgi:uncharacterized protein YggE
MKHLFIVLSVLLSTAVFGQNGEKNFIDQNYIEVTGKAIMEISPDEIFLRILINEKEIKGKSLVEVENSMIAKLQEIGIETKKDLAIIDYTSNFKNYWISKSDIVLTKEYQLLVHDAKVAGKVFQELQKLGISNISIDRIENSKIQEYRKEVKINAIKAAQEKANSLAIAINQTIGKAIYIQELENNYLNSLTGKVAGIQIRGANSITSMSNSQEPEIEFEKIKLDYSILVRFELK